MQITYLCPATNKPSGGIRRIFRHVEFLVDAGYDACVGLPGSYKQIDWLDHDVPIVATDVFNANENDTFVIPDGFVHVLEAVKDQPVKKVVLALGFLSPFYRMPYGKTWEDFNIDAVMTNNSDITDFLYFSKMWPAHKPVHLVHTSVDKRLFQYDPTRKRKLVACYDKHNSEQMSMLSKIMNLRGHKGWEWVQLDGYSLKEYADIINQANIFLCHMFCEGLSVPILEAMVSGCLCVGSHGVGGKAFVVDNSVRSLRLGRSAKNFIIAKAGDLHDFAKKLNLAMDIVDNEREPELSNLRQNAVVTASQYTEQEEKASILNFWETFLQ